MTKGSLSFILTTTILFVFAAGSWAQDEDCLSKLDGAQTLFNNGLFEEIPLLLETCMDLFDVDDKQRAYRLIILAHYMNDDVEAAETLMYSLLKEFPEYRPATSDIMDYHFIYNSFSVKKTMDLGLSIGPSWTSGRIIEPYSPFSDKFTYRSSGPGLFIAASIDVPVNKILSINSEPGFILARYEIHYENTINGIINIQQSETNSFIQLPFYAKGTFLESKFQPYAKAGFMFGFLVGAKTQSNIERLNSETGEIIDASVSIQSDHKDFRNKVYFFLGGGIGCKMNFNKMYLFAELDYHISLNKTLKKGTNRYDQKNLWTQGWIDSDFGLRSTSIRVGIARSLYKINKVR